MIIKETKHSKVIETFYPENFVMDTTGVKPDLVNSVRLADSDSLELMWLISLCPPTTKDAIVDYEFFSIVQFSDLTNYDNDLKTMIMVVYDSYSNFSHQLKLMSGTAPMIEPKFDEIALKAFEVLTDAGLY